MAGRSPVESQPWQALWAALDTLQRRAQDLRRLSQAEPLLGARPDYPRARVGRSHAGELQTALDDLAGALAGARDLVPAVLQADPPPPGTAPGGPATGGLAADESPAALSGRLDALARMAETLRQEAVAPPPPLPQHAPPYLAHAPADLPGAKAITLCLGLESAVASLRNALLARLNADAGTG